MMKRTSFLGVSARRSCISFLSITGWGIELDYCDIEWFALETNRDLYSQQKTRQGADCVSDHELLSEKFSLKLQKVGKATRPFRYD